MSRTFLLALCAATMLAAGAEFLAASGFGDAPAWLGIWGNTVASSGQPFFFKVRAIDPGRASDRGGLHEGDLIDIRKNDLAERFSLFGQPFTGRPVTLWIRRGAIASSVSVVPQPLDFPRRWDVFLNWPGMIWISLFAGLIAWRRSYVREMGLLSLALVGLAFWMATDEHSFAAPWTWVYVVLSMLNVVAPLSIAAWAASAACLARPLSPARRAITRLTYALVAVSIAVYAARVFGTMTLLIDPIALASPAAQIPIALAVLAAVACGALAVAASPRFDRQRAAWLMVPPAILFVGIFISQNDQPILPSYAAWLTLNYVNAFVILAIPVVLTYVALSRRLVDIGFVLNRAVVFGAVSTIVVGAFVLAEWIAGAWFVNASHASSAVAGAIVALALGLSMRYIHKYVDRFVDRVFFRKRYENEAAMRNFAHEAAYITDRSVLLQRALREVCEHTDADGASILVLNGAGTYAPAGGATGDGMAVSENDPGIVALRAWHKPVDLHVVRDTELRGELAFPMVARGELVGTLVCGPKRDGDAYAPDESGALQDLAQGVGAALDSLSNRGDGTLASLQQTLARILERQDALASKLERALPPS